MTHKPAAETRTTDGPLDDLADRSESGASSRSFVPPGRAPDSLENSGRRSGPVISKTVLNFAVDALLLTLVVSLLFTTAVLRLVFPAPSTSGGWMLWGYGYDAWSNFQFGLVTVIGLAILFHVMLHWSWVCGVVATRLLRRSGRAAKLDDGQQTLWGVGMLIVVLNILGLLVGLAYLSIRSPAG